MDAVYKAGMEKVKAKYLKGVEEHGGVGMSAANLPPLEWLKMLQEEAIDTVFYCEAILQKRKKEDANSQ